MNKLLLVLLLVAGCHDSCNETRAAQKSVGPEALCAANHDMAICLSKDTVYGCAIDGFVSFDATCKKMGKVIYE